MSLNNEPFENISNGITTIELRLYDYKSSNLNIGDYIVFTNISNNNKMAVKVRALHRYASFKDLFPLTKCGFDKGTSIDEAVESMRKIYKRDDEMSLGVLGIGLGISDLDYVVELQKFYEEQNFDRLFPDGMK